MVVELKQKFNGEFEEGLLEDIVRVGTFRAVPENFELIDIGEPIKGVPLLLNGAIKVSREDVNGDELLLYYLEEGDSCAMTMAWEMGNQKSKIRAVTELPSELIMVPLTAVEHWSSLYSSWRKFIFKSYHMRLEELMETIDSIAFDQLETRLWEYLLEKKRITKNDLLTITHQNIAQEIYSSRVVISRLLKRLEHQNKIKLQRNTIEILV